MITMKNRKGYVVLITVIIITVFNGWTCKMDKSKMDYINTVPVCNNTLYVEGYRIISGGAYGGDRVSDYLTDSTNFRKYIATYINSNAFYSYICKQDSIYIIKGVV